MSEVARIAGHEVRLGRTEAGVATIVAGDIGGFLAGLGYVHARDRGLQLWLTRLIAQGRLCECLKDDPVALGVDGFMRRHGFSRIGEEEVGLLPEATRQRAALYAEGIAAGLAAHGIPFEFRLVGYRPEPWRIADTLAIIALMGYAGLAQTQQDIEKFIIQAIAAGVDLAGLKRLFAPHLDGVESSVIEAIRSLILIEPLTPGFPPFVPVARASNNWVVAGTRSASGKPLFATDPHLEINRLPAVWAEVVGRWGQGHGAGITAPGIPGLVMGRTDRIAFGLTYGFMDQIDHVIEEIKDGKARRQGGWEPLRLTKEVIRRKGAADHVLTSISTSHGLLECGDGLPKDGRYLAIANSTRGGGAAASLAAILAAPEARDVREAQAILRNSALSGNWVLADAEGHIAYQQSGWLPERAKPGLAPTLGWAPEPHWLGRVPGEHLAALVDPPGGVLATANDGADRPGVALAMGDDRVDRIRALIGDRKGLTAADMTAIQADLFSLQADRLLAAFLPDMEEGPVKTALAAWDRRYDAASKGATLFERFYGALCEEVFGAGFFGREAWRRMVDETALFAAYFSLFDRALLSGDGVWFKPRGRKAVMAAALAKLASDAPAWGEVNRFTFTQLFFAGLLPKWTGFDRGPFPMPGGRATISQGQLMTAYGRRTSFAPSWRCVADFGEGGIHTALPGGPSDRRFSRLYASDLERYLAFATKRLDPGGL